MVVQTNILAMNANRMYGVNVTTNRKSTEKLASGYKINRAADNAAGLTISEKMRSQIRGLTQASDNCQDGVSFAQIADGALNEVHDMLHRVKELSVQASNGTLTDADRAAIDAEARQITSEIDRVKQSTQFNTIEIFPETGRDPGEALNNSVITRTVTSSGIEIKWEFVDSDGNKVDQITGTAQGTGSKSAYGETQLAKFSQTAASSAVDKLSNALPTLFGNAATKGVTLGLELGNIDGKSGTAAYVQASYGSNGVATGMQYTLKVDTTDYPLTGPSTTAEKADLAAVIAHEMTHAVMDDTLTTGMFSTFPGWFKEGMAQTASGDNGWISNRLNPSSSNADVVNVMNSLSSSTNLGKYGSGYLAVMDLGYEVAKKMNPGASMNSSTIASGLDKLLSTMSGGPAGVKGKTLDEALNELTDYTSVADFETKFKSGAGDTLSNVKDLLAARGTGAGSILGNLSDSESSLFGNPTAGGTTYYAVNTEYTKMGNGINGSVEFPKASEAVNGEDIMIQAGAQNSQAVQIPIKRYCISSIALFGASGIDLSQADGAKEAMDVVDLASDKVSAIRSYYGALQNRLEHTISNLDNIVENTQAAESAIRDTDMATEMVKNTMSNILMRASQSMLASANQNAQNVLSLLQ